MTETLLMTGKLIASSALLYAFYWLVLRNRASYTLSRLYLLLIPFVSLAMSGLTFEVYSSKASVWEAGAAMSAAMVDAPAADNTSTLHAEQDHYKQTATMTAAEVTATADDWMSDSEEHFQLFVQLCGIVSVVLLLIAAYHFISLYRIGRRLEGETTPEGYRLIHSPEVSAPCSFIKTIFMPVGLSYDKDRLILEHEKAHIRHTHFVDVWVMELMTRLLWFNPFLWLTRCELRNIHEFEADHDVLTGGADVNAYQTLLLAQVIDNGSPYANGFNHSFIRRRFVEMKCSTAGTLGRLGKLCIGVWLALLFCGFTFTEKSAKPAEPTSISQLDLAEPQMFTIEGVVNDSISAAKAAVVLADDYLVFPERGDSTSVAFISNKHFSYSIPLKRMTAGRIRLISPEGKIAPTGIDMFFVPGQTVTLNIHSNGEYALVADSAANYFRKALRDINALRNATNWQSPHLPKLSGKKWENVECESMGYPYYNVKEIIFGKNATYVRLYADDVFSGGPIHIEKGAYLLDLKGNKYAMKWAVPDDTGRLEYLHSNVFGSYYAFEPVPDNVEELTFIEPDNEAGSKSDITIKHVFAYIKEAKEVKPNFQVDVTVTQGIDDSGYIVELFDHPHTHRYSQTQTDIPVHNRHSTFTTHLAKPYMGQFTAIFPDGSICAHSMHFPFVPGERAELTVKNGFFYLTGSKFYKDYGAADELVENARNFQKQEETDKLLRDYLTAHADEEGCVIYYLQEHILPKETIEKAMPSDMLTGRFQDIMKKWYDVGKISYKQ